MFLKWDVLPVKIVVILSADNMFRLIDLTGKTFGKLTVVKKSKNRTPKGNIYWECYCECNPNYIFDVLGGSLRRNATKSCGKCGFNKKPKKKNRYEICDDYAIGYFNNTHNTFLVDLDDLKIVEQYNWYENDQGYCVTQKDRKNIRLHRLILDIHNHYSSDIRVDHINHNRLDNRKNNLRIVTNQQNSMNKKSTGVHFDKKSRKWIGRIMFKRETIYKSFETYAEAKDYRLFLEKEYFGEYAYKESLNNIYD